MIEIDLEKEKALKEKIESIAHYKVNLISLELIDKQVLVVGVHMNHYLFDATFMHRIRGKINLERSIQVDEFHILVSNELSKNVKTHFRLITL